MAKLGALDFFGDGAATATNLGVDEFLGAIVDDAFRRFDANHSGRIDYRELRSALALLARFSDACPDRELFRTPRWFGDLDASAYNEWTMILFVWWAATSDSSRTACASAAARPRCGTR